MNSAERSEEPAYSVALSSSAYFVYAHITVQSDLAAVDKVLGMLADFPHMGVRYEPAYAANTLGFPARVIYAGHYAIYYEVDDEARAIGIDYIEDQRRDLANRFTDIEGFYG